MHYNRKTLPPLLQVCNATAITIIIFTRILQVVWSVVMEAIKLTIDSIDYFYKILSCVQYMLLQFYFFSCFLFFFFFPFTGAHLFSLSLSFSLMRLCRKSLLKEKHFLWGVGIFCHGQHASWIHPHSPLQCLPPFAATDNKLLIWLPRSFALWPPLLYSQFFPVSVFLILWIPAFYMREFLKLCFSQQNCSESLCLSVFITSSMILQCVQGERLVLFSILVRAVLTYDIILHYPLSLD